MWTVFVFTNGHAFNHVQHRACFFFTRSCHSVVTTREGEVNTFTFRLRRRVSSLRQSMPDWAIPSVFSLSESLNDAVWLTSNDFSLNNQFVCSFSHFLYRIVYVVAPHDNIELTWSKLALEICQGTKFTWFLFAFNWYSSFGLVRFSFALRHFHLFWVCLSTIFSGGFIQINHIFPELYTSSCLCCHQWIVVLFSIRKSMINNLVCATALSIF